MVSRNCKILGIPFTIGAVILILGFILGFVVFPTIITNEIYDNVVLEENTTQWDRFVTIPFPINFSVNFFTIENPEETLNGAKPKVKEVGPYIYSETRVKDIISVEGEAVTYNEVWSFEFNSEASGNKTENDIIHVVNAPLMAVLQRLEDLPIALPVELDIILSDIFEDTNVFFNVKVQDYAFNGIKMCDPTRSTTGYSKLICLSIMIMNQKLLKYNEDRSMMFSLFGYKKNPDGPFVLNRGTTEIEKLGLITNYKGQEYTEFWNGEKTSCDKVEGHYTTFPPHFKQNTEWQVYSTDICKSGIIHYNGESVVKEVHGYRFQTDQFSFSSPAESCVCINATKGLDGQSHCFSAGVLDLHSCFGGAPVILSFPHLMFADEQYQTTVDGLNNEYDAKHNTIIDFEPHVGYPLQGSIKLQFNLVLRPVTYAGALTQHTKNLSRSLFPILWLEDSFQLTDELIEELNTELLNNLIIVEGVKWGVIGLGGVIVVITVVIGVFRKVC